MLCSTVLTSGCCVNEGTDDNEVDQIELGKLGVQRQEPMPMLAYLQAPPPRMEQQHRFYPDRVVELNYIGDKSSHELKIELSKARVLKFRVVLPNGHLATNVQTYAGQEPFRQQTTGGLSAIKKTGEGQFAIAHRDLSNPISVAFIQHKDSVGIVTEFTADQISDEPVTVALRPFGRATVRFVDASQQPLASFRPLVWMSLPKKPFSSAVDLERLATPITVDNGGDTETIWLLRRPFDSIWTALLHEHHNADLKTDDEGRVGLEALIPDATYRITQFNGEVTDFGVKAGETVDLGTLVIHEPDLTADLPFQ